MSPTTPKPVATSDPKPVDPRAIGNLKHGLTGARLYFSTEEDAEAYRNLKTALLKELAPETEIMRDLALQIATDRYRLMSAAELESKIYRVAVVQNEDKPVAMVEAETWLKDGERITRIELYSSRIQRRYEKNFALYRQLQAERKASLEAAVEEAAQLAELAESKAETSADAPLASVVPGEPFQRRNFGFSPDEIASMIARYRRLQEARRVSGSAAPPRRPFRKAA